MAKSKPLPRGPAFRKEWDRLDTAGRRRVRRAASRGQPAATRKEAALAASMAMSQRRLWQWAWLVGPVLVAAVRYPDGWRVVLANLAVGIAIFGLMGVFFARRARRAELINREIFDGRRRPG